MRNVKTLEEWEEIEQLLLKKGYTLFQIQYDTNHQEGFQARFMNKKGIIYEIKTYNRKIEKEIINYYEKSLAELTE